MLMTNKCAISASLNRTTEKFRCSCDTVPCSTVMDKCNLSKNVQSIKCKKCVKIQEETYEQIDESNTSISSKKYCNIHQETVSLNYNNMLKSENCIYQQIHSYFLICTKKHVDQKETYEPKRFISGYIGRDFFDSSESNLFIFVLISSYLFVFYLWCSFKILSQIKQKNSLKEISKDAEKF